jgi:hypothetical protein
MNADPYSLDQTNFAKIVREIQNNPLADDLDEPSHPLRENSHTAALCHHLEQVEKQLFHSRKPDGGMGDDAYFRFNEGLELRPEVIAKIAIDYIKQHPEVISG